MTDGRKPSDAEWQKIVEKLQSVFKKETQIPSGPILGIPNFSPLLTLMRAPIPDCGLMATGIYLNTTRNLPVDDVIVNKVTASEQIIPATQPPLI